MLTVAAALATLLLIGLSFAVSRVHIRRLRARVDQAEWKTSKLNSECEAQALLNRQMSLDLEDLRKLLAQKAEPMLPAGRGWGASDVPVNLNRRGQILRLSQKGKSVVEIAHDLHVAQGEVELLLKVHDLSRSESDPGTFG